MKDISDSTLAGYGLSVLVRHGGGAVVIVRKLRKEYDNASTQEIVSIERWMEHWCDGRDLPPERFKLNLRRNQTARIDEFKSYQLRAYGFSVTVAAKKLFIVTAIDIKKQNKASTEVLDRAERLAKELKVEMGYG